MTATVATAAAPRGLEVDGVRVRFDGRAVLDGASLHVATGEVVALLGPSGCGKSTLLRVVAGLQVPDEGRVCWHGDDITNLAAHRRGIGLMFQDHALFPHRRVGQNVEFGLRMRHVDTAERRSRVAELLELVGLAGYEQRTVDTLSGGEAQRVALARALAPRPALLLLDEPFGSLDRNRRNELTDELGRVLRATGQTALHVTHDHDEAFAIADRVAIMGPGRVVRAGTPRDVWEDPGSVEVARFLGHENVLDARALAALGVHPCADAAGSHDDAFLLRPDAVRAAGPGEAGIDASVRAVRFAGATSHVVAEAGPLAIRVAFVTSAPLAPGDRVRLVVDPGGVRPLSS